MSELKVHVTWRQVDQLCRALADQLEPHRDQITGIVPVLFGGVIPASMVAYYLKLPLKRVVELPTDLIIDEIVDSGKTLARLNAEHPNNPFACLFLNTDNFKGHTQPIHVTEVNAWAVFPWEK